MLTDFETLGPEAKRFHPASKMAGVARYGINTAETTEPLREVEFQDVDVKPAWTMKKTVEKFGDAGGPESGIG